MVPTIGSDAFITVIKFAALVFTFVHLGFALALFRQVMNMNSKVSTHNGGCFRTFSLLHILLLSGIILLIVLI